MKSYSQYGEDLWILENIKIPPNGTFCDVGAYDGIESSNTYALEQLGWRGICIEAVPETFFKCRDNRTCYCLCMAATDRDGLVDFAINESEPGLSGIEAIGRVDRMEGDRVDNMWGIFNYGHLNLLSIDTEGTELQVWEGSKSLHPDIVVIEFLTVPSPPRDKEILAQLESDGYREVHRTDANLILVKKDHYERIFLG